jgi:hypothetical protein
MWLSILLLFILAIAYLPCLGDRAALKRIAREDGPYESMGALYFFAAAGVFTAFYLRSRRTQEAHEGGRRLVRGPAVALLLGCVFFVAGMEEISWGQRILGVKTPERLARVNRQRETNLHNLEFFHGNERNGQRKDFWGLSHNLDRLFSLFNITVGFGIPVACRWSRRARRLARLVGMPNLPLSVGLLFVANYVMSKTLELRAATHAVVEIKEHNAALLWLCTGLVLLLRPVPRSAEVPLPQVEPA